MTLPTWLLPPSGLTARGVSLVPYGSGMAVSDWTQPVLWPFSGGAFLSPVTLGSGSVGFAGAASDTSGGIWVATFDGTLWHQPYLGPATGYATGGSSGAPLIGAYYAGGSGFAVSSSGKVYSSSGVFATLPSGTTLAALSGTTMVSYQPAGGPSGTLTTLNMLTAVTGSITMPAAFSTAACVAMASGASLAIGGYVSANTVLLSGAAAAAMSPQNNALMVAVGSGFALQWAAAGGAYAENWSQIQAVTGLSNLGSVAWRPDGTQVLATNPVSGLQVLNYSAGNLSLAQTLAISNARGLMVAGDSVHGLVVQNTLAQVAPITYSGGVWSSGTPVTGLTNILGIAPYGLSGAVAAVSGGLQYLNLAAGAWSIAAASATLGFNPVALKVDQFNQVYAVGPTRMLAVVSGTTVVGSGTWASTAATDIAVRGNAAMIAMNSGIVKILGLSSPGVWTQQQSISLPSGSPVLAVSDTVLFALTTGVTSLYAFSGAPFTGNNILSGGVALWNGASWASAAMGVGQIPSAMGFDLSGGVWVTTVQDTLWHVSGNGSVLSSGAIGTYTGQLSAAFLCASAVLVSGGGTYVATSIPGVMVQVA